ncbi:MAG: hypothetical protein B7O98_07610 [Zestosphaera tikiterensis]|uniref:DUF4129 domain-containing protein n=1 Tax=Zestosphaera tikiterensis TaxID=1973259 RepID=A0A2R7Y551_9CREN|nr:MAG: hypothetical protein B7O98_07610 [Zestosphaera tikiterensis]
MTLTTLLIIAVLIASTTPVALASNVETRHSLELVKKALIIETSAKILKEWLESVGYYNLSLTIDEALKNEDLNTLNTIAKHILKLYVSNNSGVLPLFIGGKHLISAKVLSGLNTSTVRFSDYLILVNVLANNLNLSGNQAFAKLLLNILDLSGDLSSDVLIQFILLISDDRLTRSVSQDLRKSLRQDILNFLDLVDMKHGEKALKLSMDVSYNKSLIIGSLMFIIAGNVKPLYNYLWQTPQQQPQASKKDVEKLLKDLNLTGLSEEVLEILSRLPPEVVEELLKNPNMLEILMNEDLLLNELHDYLSEDLLSRRYLNVSTQRNESRPYTTVLINSGVLYNENLEDLTLSDEFGYAILQKIAPLLENINKLGPTIKTFENYSSKPYVEVGIIGGKPSITTAFEGLTPVILLIAPAIASIALIFRYLTSNLNLKGFKGGISSRNRFVVMENLSEVIKTFWEVVDSLAHKLGIVVEDHETHREIKNRIVDKLKVKGFRHSDLIADIDRITLYYELIRFARREENGEVIETVKRIGEKLKKLSIN